MTLIETITQIQRELGVRPDGKFGPVTAANVLAQLQARHLDFDAEKTAPATVSETHIFDARTEKNLATLDPKAVPYFREFICLAQASAATLDCEYILIGGNRTWQEQDALYAQGRTQPGKVVTKAKGGQSNHNFGIAGDFGVFMGKRYLDDVDPAYAAKVHKICSLHAGMCGLEWGGSWKSIVDLPHYQVETADMTTAAMRKLYLEKGSVL